MWQAAIRSIRERCGSVNNGIGIEDITRQNTIQSAHARLLRMVVALPALPTDEADVHERLAASRIRGEWFAMTPEVREWIAEAQAVADDL